MHFIGPCNNMLHTQVVSVASTKKVNTITTLVIALVQLGYIATVAELQKSGTLLDDGLCSVINEDCQQCPDYIAMPQSRGWCPYNVVSVDWYGAMGDGQTDDTQAFEDAWSDACALDSAVFIIPEGKTYLVGPINFKGPCGSSLTVELTGTIMAPADPNMWNKSNSNAWLHFSHLNDLTVEGGGMLDGQGQQWWDKSCKKNKSQKCHEAPTAMRFSSVHDLKVRNVQSVNSPQIHITFSHCYAVQAVNLQVVAPSTSPNTDGIHISGSQNVLIKDSYIGTGDDCVSIVSGSSDVRMKNITCGPGHGISIGSLGKGQSEDTVSLVVVDGAIISGTTNGLRIKTWPGGTGSAIGFRFQNVQMINVSNPIIIDQNYCDHSSPCSQNETSAVQVSQVFYKNIWGTSATHQAIRLDCSNAAPCKNLLLQDVELTLASGTGNATALCQSAQGVVKGTVIPSVDCLEAPQSRKPRCVM